MKFKNIAPIPKCHDGLSISYKLYYLCLTDSSIVYLMHSEGELKKKTCFG